MKPLYGPFRIPCTCGAGNHNRSAPLRYHPVIVEHDGTVTAFSWSSGGAYTSAYELTEEEAESARRQALEAVCPAVRAP